MHLFNSSGQSPQWNELGKKLTRLIMFRRNNMPGEQEQFFWLVMNPNYFLKQVSVAFGFSVNIDCFFAISAVQLNNFFLLMSVGRPHTSCCCSAIRPFINVIHELHSESSR